MIEIHYGKMVPIAFVQNLSDGWVAAEEQKRRSCRGSSPFRWIYALEIGVDELFDPGHGLGLGETNNTPPAGSIRSGRGHRGETCFESVANELFEGFSLQRSGGFGFLEQLIGDVDRGLHGPILVFTG